MFNDPKILITAFIGGIIPSLLWMWFWITQEEKKPEPKGLLLILFVLGMIAVIFVLPIQRFIQQSVDSKDLQLILFASTEEIMKYLAVIIIVYKTRYIEDPIEWPIYIITAALGFAALENALFLIKPLSLGQDTVGLLTGELRFLGSTLLHTVSSGIVGIAMGISLYMEGLKRVWHLIVGLILAIALHSVFNFFIIRTSGNNFLEILKVFGFLWVVTIIVMLLYEKVRRMN